MCVVVCNEWPIELCVGPPACPVMQLLLVQGGYPLGVGRCCLLPCIARVALHAARNSALAAYQAPPYDATAIAHEAACRINAVCVQLAHVLAW